MLKTGCLKENYGSIEDYGSIHIVNLSWNIVNLSRISIHIVNLSEICSLELFVDENL